MHNACGKDMAAAIRASSIDVYSDDEITEILASIKRIPCFKKDKSSLSGTFGVGSN